ncbi:MAG: [NiFe]-hydrogenase assembly chaperone HybE [Rubricella sp.]
MNRAATFEGSYLGAQDKISDAAVMECKVCWTPYDPVIGDDTRAIMPGTPFRALPGDWTCPVCSTPKEQFMVYDDPGTALDQDRKRKVDALVAEFREIHNAKMRDVPLSNRALSVEAVGFREWEGHHLGVLVTPWFMNLTLLPGPGEDWSGLTTGETEIIAFPSGAYPFLHTVRKELGGYKGCSLFSPMAEFASQLAATDVARAVMQAIFDPANRSEETDRRHTIREAAESLQAPPDIFPDASPSRRAVLTAGLSGEGPAE